MHPSIILIDQLEEFGGSEVQALYLAKAFAARGHRTQMWTFLEGAFARHCKDHGAEVRSFRKTGVLRPDGARLYRELESAARDFSRGEPTLVMAFHTASNLLSPVLSRRLPHVATIGTRRDMGFIRKPIHDVLQRPLNHWVSRVVAVSSEVKWIVALREGMDPDRITVIPNGVDIDRFRPVQSDDDKASRDALRSEFDVSDGEVLVVTVGSLKPFKGQATVIDAVAGLVRSGQRVKLLMVGDGPGRTDLEAMVSRLGVESAMRFSGRRIDIPELLRASDIFALASHTEGFSNAVLEAMSTGLPVVVTDVGGSRTAVPEGAGWILPVNDSVRFERVIGQLCASPTLRADVGAEARRVAIEEHSIDKMLQRYIDVGQAAVESVR